MSRIEDLYADMCLRSNHLLYWYTYCLVKYRLEKSYFPFIRDVQPFITDHSLDHVNRILEKFSRFLKPHLPVPGNLDDRVIDLENLHLLMHAALWHDLGNLFGRIGHAKRIDIIFNQSKSFLYEPPHYNCILHIAEGHSGTGSIETKIEDACVSIYDNTVYPQFLSAMLRISDEIDEDSRRVEGRVVSMVSKESQAYWQFCLFNESIIPVYVSDSLGNVSLQIQIESKIKDKDVRAKLGKNTEEVIAIEEYINRINKMNQERIYCNKFLQQYSSLYFSKIDKISTKIKICDDKDKILDKIHFDFTDDSKGTDFFTDSCNKKIIEKY